MRKGKRSGRWQTFATGLVSYRLRFVCSSLIFLSSLILINFRFHQLKLGLYIDKVLMKRQKAAIRFMFFFFSFLALIPMHRIIMGSRSMCCLVNWKKIHEIKSWKYMTQRIWTALPNDAMCMVASIHWQVFIRVFFLLRLFYSKKCLNFLQNFFLKKNTINTKQPNAILGWTELSGPSAASRRGSPSGRNRRGFVARGTRRHRVFRLEIQLGMLVFSHQRCELFPSIFLPCSTPPPAPPSMCQSTVHTDIV